MTCKTQSHVHYADYTDSHWYSGSPTDGAGIWIRNPIIDGDPENTLDQAMELLDQARKETQAIEAALGTDPAGSHTRATTRLSKRLSPSGIRRGGCYWLRGPNPVAGTYSTVHEWYNKGAIYYQFGEDGPYTGVTSQAITFTKSYFTSLAPDIIVCTAATTGQRLLAIQPRPASISTSGFTVDVRGFNAAGSWSTPDFNWYVVWCAIGGFPSS